MSGFVSNRRLIKYALVYMLGQPTYNRLGTGSGPVFPNVTADPSQQYNKEPFCLVLRAPSLDKKGAVGEQDHTIGFQVIIVLSLENKKRPRQETQDWMDDLEELALTALDEGDWQDALNHAPSPPTNSTWMLNTTKVEQYIGTGQSGRLLICCIDVEVMYTTEL